MYFFPSLVNCINQTTDFLEGLLVNISTHVFVYTEGLVTYKLVSSVLWIVINTCASLSLYLLLLVIRLEGGL